MGNENCRSGLSLLMPTEDVEGRKNVVLLDCGGQARTTKTCVGLGEGTNLNADKAESFSERSIYSQISKGTRSHGGVFAYWRYRPSRRHPSVLSWSELVPPLISVLRTLLCLFKCLASGSLSASAVSSGTS